MKACDKVGKYVAEWFDIAELPSLAPSFGRVEETYCPDVGNAGWNELGFGGCGTFGNNEPICALGPLSAILIL